MKNGTLTLASVTALLAFEACALPAHAQERAEAIHLETALPNREIVLVGASVFGASYLPSFVVGIESGRGGDAYLAVPLAGPWIDLAMRGGCDGVPCGTEAIYKALIIASGVAQAYGVAAAVTAFVVPDYELRVSKPAAAPMALTPARVGQGGYGLSLVGIF